MDYSNKFKEFSGSLWLPKQILLQTIYSTINKKTTSDTSDTFIQLWPHGGVKAKLDNNYTHNLASGSETWSYKTVTKMKRK